MKSPKKVMLQNRNSHLYYQAGGRWTSNPEKADNFGQMTRATEFAGMYRLSDLDIVLNFGDPQYDLRFAVAE